MPRWGEVAENDGEKPPNDAPILPKPAKNRARSRTLRLRNTNFSSLLERFEQTGDPFAGSTDERQAGNGSLMRLAPVALVYLDDEAEAIRIAREQSRLTHAALQCVDACDYFVQLLRSTMLGGGHPLELARWFGHPNIEAAKTAYWGGRERRFIRSGGYVAETLEAALWAVGSSATFEDALVAAVNLGSDADTVGAVAGALAGAKYGASSIPSRWLGPLAWREDLEDLASSLVRTGSEVHRNRS